MQFTIKDKDGTVVMASKPFKTVKAFAKWFAESFWMFNNTYQFSLGLTPIAIYYNKNNTISIKNKETTQWVYKGE